MKNILPSFQVDRDTSPRFHRRDALRFGIGGAMALAFLGAGCSTTTTTPNRIAVRKVRSSAADGIELAVYESGNPRGRPVIFVHGFAQSSESWARQMQSSELGAELRLISFDLRGHGNSDKPLARDAYHDPVRWANDLRSVMRATGADKPCIVSWSYGGRVVNDYLATFGDAEVGSLNYVAATSTAQRFGLGTSYALIGGMLSDDPAIEAKATEDFLHACFETQPSQADFENMKRFNAQTPVAVRKLLAGRPADYDDALRKLKVPVLVTHGDKDRISAVAMSEYTVGLVKASSLSIYSGAGHSTFFEQPARFDSELIALTRRTL